MKIQELIKQVKNYICKDCIKDVFKLSDQLRYIDELNTKFIKENQELHDSNKALSNLIDELNKELSLHETKNYPDEFLKGLVKKTYPAEFGIKMDVRNLILDQSYILEPIAKKLRVEVNGKLDEDQTAMNILIYVKNRLKYRLDQQEFNMLEMWENPEITWSKKLGDCESGSILWATLCLLAGIRRYKVRVSAGPVWNPYVNKEFGHSWGLYNMNGKWYVMDWTFFPEESIRNFGKVDITQQDNIYRGIWFTFNHDFTWRGL